MPLVIYGLEGGHTNTHTHTLLHESEPGACCSWHSSGLKIYTPIDIHVCYGQVTLMGGWHIK